ncbi:tyrosine-type recombinase/integrase [Intestinibacillus massiliensis]|uniref:tyrosine-type recombinase/integrase n=1 Tax=Intestinibacillus massiliensis TaxID=1871029 RepID=UPI000B3637E2|nr:tyrosine-type recombinase/integrase [Intestinibacillus massiliensis]
MVEHKLTGAQIAAFGRYLREEEQSPGTREKYCRDVRAFAAWLDGRSLTKEIVTAWKEHLTVEQYAPVTINAMLASIHAYLRFTGRGECRVKYLKLQRRLFRDGRRELTREEYSRLLDTARTLGRERLALVMEAMGATGVRVSEVKYITVEAVLTGRAEIFLKGKVRTILLPGKLCRKLLKYAKRKKIASGEIFLTRDGGSLSRKQIWAEMKALSQRAGVADSKVFPHNLRHLFATAFYRACKDIAKLADLLGHSSIETTRIYLVSTGAEHSRQLERLGLVS